MDINYVFAGGIGLLSGLALSQYVYALLRQQMIRRLSEIASQLDHPAVEVPPKLWSVEEMRVFSHAVVVLLEGMLPLREVEAEFVQEQWLWQVRAKDSRGNWHTMSYPVRREENPMHPAVGERILLGWERLVKEFP